MAKSPDELWKLFEEAVNSEDRDKGEALKLIHDFEKQNPEQAIYDLRFDSIEHADAVANILKSHAQLDRDRPDLEPKVLDLIEQLKSWTNLKTKIASKIEIILNAKRFANDDLALMASMFTGAEQVTSRRNEYPTVGRLLLESSQKFFQAQGLVKLSAEGGEINWPDVLELVSQSKVLLEQAQLMRAELRSKGVFFQVESPRKKE